MLVPALWIPTFQLLLSVIITLNADTIDWSSRMVSSKDAEKGHYPFMVAIKKHGSEEEVPHCGGSILTSLAVITSCSCLIDEKALRPFSDYYAIVGTVDTTTEDEQKREFKQFYIHVECNTVPKGPSASDVGLALVDKPFTFNDNVQPVKFVSSNKKTILWWYDKFASIGKVCHVPGWGATDAKTSKGSTHLQDGLVKLIGEQQCKKCMCDWYKTCEDNIERRRNKCALPYRGSVPCRGDKGGPLVCNGYFFGILSSGPSNCEAYAPGKSNMLVPILFCSPSVILEFVKYHLPDYEVAPIIPHNNRDSVVSHLKYKFVVSIANVTNHYAPWSLCTGSILTDSTVVTTCMCLKQLTFSVETGLYKDVVVIPKVFDLYNTILARALKIKKIVLHKKCKLDRYTVLYDVGIAFLDGRFSFLLSHVSSLRLISDNVTELREAIEAFEGSKTKCVMSTWGYSIGQPKEILYHLFAEWNVTLSDPEKCKTVFCSNSIRKERCEISFDSSSALCGEAYNVSQPCFGDEGGPLICGGYFFGIVSSNGELCTIKNRVMITSVLTVFELVKLEVDDYTSWLFGSSNKNYSSHFGLWLNYFFFIALQNFYR